VTSFDWYALAAAIFIGIAFYVLQVLAERVSRAARYNAERLDALVLAQKTMQLASERWPEFTSQTALGGAMVLVEIAARKAADEKREAAAAEVLQ